MTEFELTVIRRFDTIDRHFGLIDRRFDAIAERLTLIENKLDRASGVRFDAARFLTGFARLKTRVDALEAREGGSEP